MTSLVVGDDGSPRSAAAVAAGVNIARQLGADVHVLTAVGSDDVVEPIERRRRQTRSLAQRFGVPRAHVHVRVDEDPVDALLALAVDVQDALIAVGTRGRGGMAAALLGSVADALVCRSPVPVLLTGPHHRTATAYRQVVCPLDGSSCAQAALPVAVGLADGLGCGLDLVAVVPREPPVEGLENLTAAYLRETAAALRTAHPVRWAVVRDDDPARGIVDAVDAPDALLVLSTHGRTGMARVAVGSVAVGVARRSEVPLVVTRPSQLTLGGEA